MARNTCEGSVDPAAQAEPVDTAIPLMSSASSSDSPSTPSKAEVQDIGQASGGMSVDLHIGDLRQDALLQPVAQGGQSRRLGRQLVRGQAQGRGQAPRCLGCSGFRAAAPSPGGRHRTGARSACLAAHKARRSPLGPQNLCAVRESRSTPSSSTRTGILPTAWTASVCTRMPRAWARRAISASGWIVPTSLLASMTLTRVVSGRRLSC